LEAVLVDEVDLGAGAPLDDPALRNGLAGEQAQQGGLAAAVTPDDSYAGVGFEFEVQVGEQDAAVDFGPQVFEGDHSVSEFAGRGQDDFGVGGSFRRALRGRLEVTV
jgi:hypothetical protein